MVIMKDNKDILYGILRLLLFIVLTVGSYVELRITHSHSICKKLSILAFAGAAVLSLEVLHFAIIEWKEHKKDEEHGQ